MNIIMLIMIIIVTTIIILCYSHNMEYTIIPHGLGSLT